MKNSKTPKPCEHKFNSTCRCSVHKTEEPGKPDVFSYSAELEIVCTKCGVSMLMLENNAPPGTPYAATLSLTFMPEPS